MTTQNNPVTYSKAIQAALLGVFSPVPVYANFNRNWATEPKFVTWNLRSVHQPVYTGTTQSIKGIDRPIFQVSIFDQQYNDAITMANTLLQDLHGFSGELGGIQYVSKCDITLLYNTYDNEIGLQQIVLDCQLDIPA